MISFKQFLFEASTGQGKWDKYFAGGPTDTIMKSSSPIYNKAGEDTGEWIEKGEAVTVLDGEYESKPLVKYGRKTVRVKFADIEKPFKKDQVVRTTLKPDQIGIVGDFKMSGYAAKVKKVIDSNEELTTEYADYLKALVDLAQKPDDTKKEDAASELYTSSGVADDTSFKNTINTDFMEILGPFFVMAEYPEYKTGSAFFPEAGNEPLYDFKMTSGDEVTAYSSKKSGGGTNTLKVDEVLKAVNSASSALKRKYALQIELMNIIQSNSAKAAPQAINLWLKKNFKGYKVQPEPTDNTAISNLERSVVKYINDESGLDFIPLVKQAIPDLWYVKSKLTTTGTISVEPLKSGQDVSSAKFRSKSSPNHISDKLGFQL